MIAQPLYCDCILPTGGGTGKELAKTARTAFKALIQSNGATLLCRTLHSVLQWEHARNIVVAGPPETLHEAAQCGRCLLAECSGTGPQNMLHGLDLLEKQPGGAAPLLLMLATDLPAVCPEALSLLLAGFPSSADFLLPLVPRRVFEQRYPCTKSTWLHLQEGEFTLACAYLIRTSMLRELRPRLEPLFAARKSQWKTARLAGPGIALRLLAGQLSVEHAAHRLQNILQCTPAALLHAPPELALDIDTVEDYQWMLQNAEKLPRGGCR